MSKSVDLTEYINEIINKFKEQSFIKVKCEDNYIGSLNIEGNKIQSSDLWFDVDKRKLHSKHINISNESIQKNKKDGKKIMIIVLESPHKKEFEKIIKKNGEFKPLPAIGPTGTNLQKHFIDTFNICMGKSKCNISDGECTYKVILMNAIQYQCSLGYVPEIFRDRIWLYLWFVSKAKDDFKERLEIYSPDVIINLCTLGNHAGDLICHEGNNKDFINTIYEGYDGETKTTLRKLVQKEIDEYSSYNKDIYLYYGNHPSSWYDAKDPKKDKRKIRPYK